MKMSTRQNFSDDFLIQEGLAEREIDTQRKNASSSFSDFYGCPDPYWLLIEPFLEDESAGF